MIARRNRTPRRGFLTVVVLLCLIVLTLIAGSILRSGTALRESMRVEERRLQAEWLAEAGLQRARARLITDPDYQGETWKIDASELGTTEAATVTITVERTADGAKRRIIRVRADYPRDPPHRSRITRQTTD